VSLDAGNLASLGGQDAQLEALMAQDTTGRGRANLLGQLQNADGKVLDAENVVQTQLAATQADLANSSPAVTKLMAAGLSREQAMSAVSSQGNAEATAA
jgi:hypothetical protein